MISNRIVALSELDYAQKIQCCYQHFHGRRWQKTNKNLMRLHQIDGNIVVPLHFAQYKKQRLNSNIDNRLHSKFLTVSAATHSTTTLYCDYVLSYSSAAALPFVLRSLLQLLFDFISVWVCMRNNFFFLFCFVCHRQCRWRSCWYWRDRTEWNMTSKNSKIYFICVHRTAVTAPLRP